MIISTQYGNSDELIKEGKITDQNHGFKHTDLIKEALGLPQDLEQVAGKDGYGVQHSITKWYDDKTPRKGGDGIPLDIILFNIDGGLVWIPEIEFRLLEEVVKIGKMRGTGVFKSFTWGYLNGRYHFLGPLAHGLGLEPAGMHPGYEMFVEAETELTFGQKSVGLSFNPSGDEKVNKAKQLIADAIDLMNDFRTDGATPGQARHASVAITDLETAQMRMVKALTWKD